MDIFFRQSLYFGVACVCVNAFHTGLLSADQAVEMRPQNPKTWRGNILRLVLLKRNTIFREHHLFARPSKLTLTIDPWIKLWKNVFPCAISEDFLTAWGCGWCSPPLSQCLVFKVAVKIQRFSFFFSTRLVVFPYLLACFFMDLCCVAMEDLCRWRDNVAVIGEMFLKIR